MISHQELIKLVVAYTLTGALVFTVIITCFSLIGWVRFADIKQQNRLFYALLVEVCVAAVGFYTRFLNFDPSDVKNHIAKDSANQVLADNPEAARNDSSLRFDDSSQRIRDYWKPKNQVSQEHQAQIQTWLRQNGIEESVAFFIYSTSFEADRRRMIKDLGL